MNADGSLTNPFDSNLRNYTASGKYQVNKNNQLSAFWTYNRKFQPHRGAGVAQPLPDGTLHQQSPKNLINGNWTSVMGQNTFLEVSSTYFHMHWPSTWADEFNALPASQQRPSTFNIDTGIYIDGPEPTGQRLRDAYRHQTNIGVTRYIDGFLGASHQLKTGFENWWTPTGTDGFEIFDDIAPALHRTGGDLQPDRPDRLRAVGSRSSTTRRSSQKTKMRELRRLRPGPRQLRAVSPLNLGLRWSYYDGTIPEQSNGGGQWFAGEPRSRRSIAGYSAGTRSRRAPASWSSSRRTARTSPRRATAATTSRCTRASSPASTRTSIETGGSRPSRGSAT